MIPDAGARGQVLALWRGGAGREEISQALGIEQGYVDYVLAAEAKSPEGAGLYSEEQMKAMQDVVYRIATAGDNQMVQLSAAKFGIQLGRGLLGPGNNVANQPPAVAFNNIVFQLANTLKSRYGRNISDGNGGGNSATTVDAVDCEAVGPEAEMESACGEGEGRES